MRRDDDYLRNMLIEMSDSDEWLFQSSTFKNASEHDAKRHYHILLAQDAGLMAEIDHQVYRMTSQGHDFVAAIRRSETWEVAKSAAAQVGGASLHLLWQVAEGYARGKLAQMGVPMG